MFRSLRNDLRAQCQEHHTIDRLEERDTERGSTRQSSLKGRQRVIVSQTNILLFERQHGGTFGRLDGAHKSFPEIVATILVELK